MDRLKQIQALVDAVDKGSLARAASAHGVSPAMLGRRIDALEERLGAKLLLRTTRRLSLTEQGALYVERCRRLLGELESAEAEIAAGPGQATGHLSVAAPSLFGRKHVAPLAAGFLAAHPQLRLSFTLTDQAIDLAREPCDMSIRIGGAVEPHLWSVRLATNRRVVCGTPGYFARHGRPRTLDELREHPCLPFAPHGGHPRDWTFQQDGRPVAVRIRGPLDCNDGELLNRWSCEGLGLAWRSTWEIQPQLASGALVTVLDEFALPHHDILAVTLLRPQVPAKVRLFIEALKSCYAQPDYWLRHH